MEKDTGRRKAEAEDMQVGRLASVAQRVKRRGVARRGENFTSLGIHAPRSPRIYNTHIKRPHNTLTHTQYGYLLCSDYNGIDNNNTIRYSSSLGGDAYGPLNHAIFEVYNAPTPAGSANSNSQMYGNIITNSDPACNFWYVYACACHCARVFVYVRPGTFSCLSALFPCLESVYGGFVEVQ